MKALILAYLLPMTAAAGNIYVSCQPGATDQALYREASNTGAPVAYLACGSKVWAFPGTKNGWTQLRSDTGIEGFLPTSALADSPRAEDVQIGIMPAEESLSQLDRLAAAARAAARAAEKAAEAKPMPSVHPPAAEVTAGVPLVSPSPAPPTTVAIRLVPRLVQRLQERMQPKAVPKQVARINEDPPPPSVYGVVGGIDSDFADWTTVGILGGVIQAAPPPPAPVTVQKPPAPTQIGTVAGPGQPPPLRPAIKCSSYRDAEGFLRTKCQ